MDILLILLGIALIAYAFHLMLAPSQDSIDLMHVRMRHMRQAKVRKASRHMPSRLH